MNINIDTITEVYPTEAEQPVRRSKSEDGKFTRRRRNSLSGVAKAETESLSAVGGTEGGEYAF
ncbi:MAG: hypothetical protein ACYS91_20890 [Planctomycetota bacterium]|jgi:hypothetical protein